MNRYCSFMDDGATVRDIIEIPAGFALGKVLSAQAAALYTACPDTVEAGWRHIDGAWLEPAAPEPMPEPGPESLEEANAIKYAEIIAKANAMDDAIKARYSKPEITSFDVQRQGAEAILANPDVQGELGSPVALVRGLAAAEGVSAADFATRIIHNVAMASAATEALLLQQRAYEAALKRAATVEEIQAITVSYILG